MRQGTFMASTSRLRNSQGTFMASAPLPSAAQMIWRHFYGLGFATRMPQGTSLASAPSSLGPD